MPKGAVSAITRYDVKIGEGENISVFNDRKYSRVRELIGTDDEIYAGEYVIPYFDVAPRKKSKYPIKAEYKAYIDKLNGDELVLFDGGTLSGDYKIYWNGEEIPPDDIKPFRVYDAKNKAFAPKWKDGKNELKIAFCAAGEFDGVNGEIFLYKKEKI